MEATPTAILGVIREGIAVLPAEEVAHMRAVMTTVVAVLMEVVALMGVVVVLTEAVVALMVVVVIVVLTGEAAIQIIIECDLVWKW